MEPPHETTVPVRYRDLDTMSHVNNAVYATYAEVARSEYFADVLDEDVGAQAEDVGAVLASLEMEFRSRVTNEQSEVVVTTRVPELGRTSIPTAFEVAAAGETAVTGEATVVVVDPAAERPRPVPDDWRAAIAAFEGIPPDPPSDPADGDNGESGTGN